MFGTDDDIIPAAQVPDLVFTNINYGDVELWGLDGSIFVFLDSNFSSNITFSFLGKTTANGEAETSVEPKIIKQLAIKRSWDINLIYTPLKPKMKIGFWV